MYIAIEGIKGAGKSTLLAQLSQQLKQEGVEFSTFNPTRPMPQNQWWEQAYGDWQHNDAFISELYTARANYHALQTDFNQPLVLGDRSILTSIVTRWQSHQHDIHSYIQQILAQEYAVPIPDLVLYLDISLESACQRLQNRQRDYGLYDETAQRLQQTKQAYTQLFMWKNEIGLKNVQIQCFDTNQTCSQLFQQVLKYVKNIAVVT
ncbi:deoxynucleoside kinase [Acinetobacter sp. NIPH 1869]|uniref:deoxynucleoside kinase n=1 Tax=Acinetobacter higginsii TaxID=70347 RepID=UPI001F4AD9E8|nr:deoxynucleoside kinase [Acinetobacter higginsii]MCH7306282.1 deoxynucleoside kinase [Acinetobacter higginsii]